MLKRELLKLCGAAAVAVAAPILIVLAAYDVTGTSPADPFATGAWSTHTPTATATASTMTPTFTPSASPTHTATATPLPCGPVPDASLAFIPSSVDLRGAGPFVIAVRIRNKGSQSAARDVVLALGTIKNAQYIDELEFPDSTTWAVNGAASSTLYSAGDIAPGGEVTIPITVRMTGAWSGASSTAEAKLRADVHSARCMRHQSKARVTTTMTRGSGGSQSSLTDGGSATPTSPADGSAPIATVTPTSTVETATPTATATATPAATDTPTPAPAETPVT